MNVLQKLWVFLQAWFESMSCEFNCLCMKFAVDQRGDFSGSIIKLVIALYVFGTIGVGAIVLVSNSTAYGSGVDSNVVTIATVLLPMMGVIAVVMLVYNKTSRGR